MTNTISKKIIRTFPFEGAIINADTKKAEINIGYSSGRGIKSGDLLDVYGAAPDLKGKVQTYRKVATLVVREVGDGKSTCDIKNLLQRATVTRGDLVVMQNRRAIISGAAIVHARYQGRIR